jgi:quinohemoprotein ethanol dehydrogenase
VKPGPGVLSFGGIQEQVVIDPNDPDDAKGALLAWDPVAQKPRWKIRQDWITHGGTMATAGGLVFQGTAEGWLTGYDAERGNQLWRFATGLGIVSPPISFAVGGEQYVAVLVGHGGSNMIGGDINYRGWKYGAQPRRLLAFRLDGKAKLPPTAPPDWTIKAVDDPTIAIDEADIAPGRFIFTMRCAMCHGLDAVSAGAPGPDLRESALAVNRDAFRQVVFDGASLPRGMPRFEMLSEEELRQLYAYVRSTAREALGTRKPSVAPAAAPMRN